MDQKLNKESMRLSDKHYDVKDYDSKDQLSSGLAVSHEQVSDTYMEGTIDGKIETSDDGKQIDIPRKGYDE
jgi:hypothetical protein